MSGRIVNRQSDHVFLELSSNDPYERGLIYGALLREEISQLVNSLPKAFSLIAENQIISRLGYVPLRLRTAIIKVAISLLEKRILQQGRKMFALFPPDIQCELRGIAAGSKQKLDYITLINTFDDISSVAFACSAVAVKNNTSYLYGFNLDYFILTQELARLVTVLRVKTSRENYISIGLPGYIGMLRGMNQHGLVIGYLVSRAVIKAKLGLAAGILLRLACTRSKTPDEAAHFIRQHLPIQGINILTGNQDAALVAECGAERCAILRPQRYDFGQAIAVTNHFQVPFMTEVQQFPEISLVKVEPAYLIELEYSQRRLAVLKDSLVKGGAKSGTIEDCRGFLDHSEISHAYTISSCFFDPANRMAVLASDGGKTPAIKGKLHYYPLE